MPPAARLYAALPQLAVIGQLSREGRLVARRGVAEDSEMHNRQKIPENQ